jgi:hypothetical protein
LWNLVWQGNGLGESIGGEKERILGRRKDQNIAHVYAWRQQNETHQTLFENVGWRQGDYNGGWAWPKYPVNLYGISTMKTLCIINIY